MISAIGPVSKNRLTGNTLKTSPRKLVFVGIGVVVLVCVVVLPLTWLFKSAYANGLAAFWESLSSPEAMFSLKFTLVLALSTAAINAVVGTVLAFTLVKSDFPLRDIFDSLVDLPMFIPGAVTGFTLLLLYGSLGILGKLDDGIGGSMVIAFPGILIAHVLITLPLVVRSVAPLLRAVDRSEEEAAMAMGAGSARVFFTVILPSIQGGLVCGSVLTFTRSFGEFGATIILSGALALQTQTAPLFILSEFNQGDIAAASSMSVVLVFISSALFLGLRLATRKSPQQGAFSADRVSP